MDSAEFRIRHHAALERLVRFDFRLTCRTGLHIGAGKSADFVGSDLPVMRDASGRPIIPGSSLRGVLRAGIEAFCLSLGIDTVVQAQDPGEPPPGTPADLAGAWRSLTPVQRLFGKVAMSRGELSYASRLQLSDAVCDGDVPVELRDGVGIHRDLRTASEGIKFDLEVVPAGTCFLGQARFKNPADYEVGLLAQALWMLDAGLLLLGGKSSRGLGWVQVEVSDPLDLKAAAILARHSGRASAQFGTVEEKLGNYLESLLKLADAAEAYAQT